ncbi:hypothetical protein BpHYR1_027542 [Brachionus plicatilis]|uniref:Uncharacterized protein n=1 Tax=Brachionus plicatilis TaxID=10195 RepID=A0A3M7SNS5_BRAPC|nr:hypothetical protein BpHYR1_027542 [Brachionus plicatilis]
MKQNLVFRNASINKIFDMNLNFLIIKLLKQYKSLHFCAKPPGLPAKSPPANSWPFFYTVQYLDRQADRLNDRLKPSA